MPRAMRKVLFCLILASPSLASAGVYKCDVNGKVAYQDRPCAGAKSDENQIEIHANRPVNTGPGSGVGNADWVAKIELENRKRDISAKMAGLEKQNAGLRKEMSAELEKLQNRKVYAANNPGTTAVEGIDEEIKSVTLRYSGLIQTNQAQIDTIKAELAVAEAPAPAVPPAAPAATAAPAAPMPPQSAAQ